MTKSELKKKAKRLLIVRRKIEAVKPLYKELDKLTDELLVIKDLEIFGLRKKSSFEKKNVVWKPTAVRQFELVPCEEERECD